MSNKEVGKNKLNKSQKRLLKDVVDIMKNPLHNDGIHYFHDESNFQKGYAIIFGPEDTLYENGVYFFDFDFPSDYPFSPPKLTYLTNNGKTRFNPNLYRNGKVCISILNTWRGEQWTSCQTIRSVLLTLTTLFHNKPLLNEPGIRETHRDFINYNTIIRYRNFETAILRVASQKLLPSQFVGTFYLIKKHFNENTKKILENIEKQKNIEVEKRQVSCSIYNMKCNIDYDSLQKNMIKALEKLN